jgi:hypothetical protein
MEDDGREIDLVLDETGEPLPRIVVRRRRYPARLSIRLQPSQLLWLRDVASKRRRSVSSVVRDLIDAAMKRGLKALAAALSLALIARAEAQITVTPQPPPKVSQAVMTLLGWIYWGLLVAVAAAFIVGGIKYATGDVEGAKKWIGGGIVGAIIFAAWPAIVSALTGG